MGIVNTLLEAVYPPTCPICDKVIRKPAGICDNCRKKLHYIHSPRCLKCGKPVDNDDTEVCFDCSKHHHDFDRGVALWGYTDETRNSIYRFKYQNCRIYSKVYADEIIKNLGDIIRSWQCDVIIPVPIHKRKYRERGFNQAQLLAKDMADVLGIGMDTKVLVRNRYTRPQKELDDNERIKNLENAFTIRENVVQYKRVLLVDDIYTTGSTIDSCAKVLKDKGTVQVFVVCLCIGQGF